jgi:lysophospholipase L1-like esterase
MSRERFVGGAWRVAIVALGLFALGARAVTAQAQAGSDSPRRFDFGPGSAREGWVKIGAGDQYSKERGFGFDADAAIEAVDRGGPDPVAGDFCTSRHPFTFQVDLPEGNYRVTVTLGDLKGEAVATVKAESRRLMLEQVKTAPGEVVTRSFVVNVRSPRIPGGGAVRLKARERGVLHWDDRLTLEFLGERPCVGGLIIEPAPDVVTIYLVGDSTVTDQPSEPWNSWGQMLPRFLGPGAVVANHAESGETLRAFVYERRLEKVLSTLKANDYLFIQFCHNDMKERGAGVGAFTTYADSLRRFIVEARNKGARPVLVTPVQRRSFDRDGKITNSLGDYPDAVRKVAKEEGVPLVDLNAATKTFYEALGPEPSKQAFVDNTHHNAYGSYEVARCVVQAIRQAIPDLARLLTSDAQDFNPAHPDPVADFRIPPSPRRDRATPDGS